MHSMLAGVRAVGNDSVRLGDFMFEESAALKELMEAHTMEEGDVGEIRWMATFPGGVQFLLDGQPWPAQKKKKNAKPHVEDEGNSGSGGR